MSAISNSQEIIIELPEKISIFFEIHSNNTISTKVMFNSVCKYIVKIQDNFNEVIKIDSTIGLKLIAPFHGIISHFIRTIIQD
ncbi:MAG: hypothetical protein AAGA80_01030, partial [Cyanobacteria bacterium P01_F01_bin.143]